MPSNPELANQIAELRKGLRLSREALARQLGVSQMAIYRWERELDVPSPSNILEIAKLAPADKKWFFLEQAGVSKESAIELMGERDGEKGSREEGHAIAIRILKSAEMAAHRSLIRAADVLSVIRIPKTLGLIQNPESSLAFISNDDGMSPLIEPGYIVVVDASVKDGKKLNGDIIAALGPGGVKLGRLTATEHVGDLLLPQSPARSASPIPISGKDGQWKIIGKVIWWIGRPQRKRN